MIRIVPAIDLRGGRCVRLQQGDYERQTTYDANPVDMVRAWEDAGAELIHIVDLDGAKDGHPVHLELIRQMTAATDTPCELGGGIRTFDDVRACLDAGISRVILGTAIIESPELTKRLLSELDPAAIVAGLDARNGKIAVRGWLEDSTIDVVELAVSLVDQGVRNIIYTDISTDGMFTGPNVNGTKRLCEACPAAQIVASGGVGNADHVRGLAALEAENLYGVIVGKALYDQRVSFAELAAAGA